MCLHMRTILQNFYFWRDIRYPSHIGRIGLHVQMQLGL